jgi:hypothetical protein
VTFYAVMRVGDRLEAPSFVCCTKSLDEASEAYEPGTIIGTGATRDEAMSAAEYACLVRARQLEQNSET